MPSANSYQAVKEPNRSTCRDRPININMSSYTPAVEQLYPGTTGTVIAKEKDELKTNNIYKALWPKITR